MGQQPDHLCERLWSVSSELTSIPQILSGLSRSSMMPKDLPPPKGLLLQSQMASESAYPQTHRATDWLDWLTRSDGVFVLPLCTIQQPPGLRLCQAYKKDTACRGSVHILLGPHCEPQCPQTEGSRQELTLEIAFVHLCLGTTSLS